MLFDKFDRTKEAREEKYRKYKDPNRELVIK